MYIERLRKLADVVYDSETYDQSVYFHSKVDYVRDEAIRRWSSEDIWILEDGGVVCEADRADCAHGCCDHWERYAWLNGWYVVEDEDERLALVS